MVGCISICTHFNSGLSCNSLNDLVLNSTDSEWMSGIFCSSWAVVSRPSSFRKSTRRLSAFTMLIFPVKEIIRHVFNRAGARERLPKFPKHETGILASAPKNPLSWTRLRCTRIYVQLLYQYISDVLLLGYNKILKSTCIKLNFISLKSNLDNNCYIISKIKPTKIRKKQIKYWLKTIRKYPSLIADHHSLNMG